MPMQHAQETDFLQMQSKAQIHSTQGGNMSQVKDCVKLKHAMHVLHPSAINVPMEPAEPVLTTATLPPLAQQGKSKADGQ